MPPLPAPGTRVSLRYRLPAGSTPPLTDVVGQLLAVTPAVRVRTKDGAVVQIAAADVVAVRELTAAPVRTAQIRATEHAAALAWPGTEQAWMGGWLLRAAHGHTHRANSAVPLALHAALGALPDIVGWYTARGVTPLLSIPDRLLRLPGTVESQLETYVMVRDVPASVPASASAVLSPRPDDDWLRLYRRDVPVDVLTAVVGGEVVFGRLGDAAVGRAALTGDADGIRWVGLSAVRVADDRRRRGHAATLCSTLLAWAAAHGASRAYVQVLVDNVAAVRLYESMGFTTQHRSRYVDARTL